MMKIINWIKDINRPVLSDRSIVNYMKRGLLIESIIGNDQIQPNSVDLTLSNSYKHIKSNAEEYVVYDNGVIRDCMELIDPINEIKYESGTFDDYIIIYPGEFMLLSSYEVLNIPNGILSFVQGRSSVARIGVQTEQAGLIDAGFRGSITFEVLNESKYPIKLYRGMRVAQVYFFKSQYASTIYGKDKGSKYSNQIEATGSRIDKDRELDKYRKVSI